MLKAVNRVVTTNADTVLYQDLPLGAVFRFLNDDGPHTAKGKTLLKIYASDCVYRFADLETGDTWSGGQIGGDSAVLRAAVEVIPSVIITRL